MVMFTENEVNLISGDKSKKEKQDVEYNYPPKLCHREYIAPAAKGVARVDTFRGAMKLTVIVGQIFGLNPVLGVFEVDTSKLRFSWSSWRCLYSIVSILLQGFFTCLCLFNLFAEQEASLGSGTTVIFYGTNFLTTVLFLNIARKWPKLCLHISKIEASDPNLSNLIERKCNISSLVVLSLAFLEHILSIISSLAIAMACQPDTAYFPAFVLQSYPFVWSHIAYNHTIGALIQIANIQCTFNWSFANVFVICLSWYLEARLEQVNYRINIVKGKHVPSSYWRKMREDYNIASNLVRKVDEIISSVIFISFANNLFAICWQLLHLLEGGFKIGPVCGVTPEERPMMHGFEQVVYFGYSFAFLMARSLAVSIIAARVHTVTKDTARGLYAVPSSAYCVEVQRLIDQVHGDNIALSGLQFFSIKRGLVLAITGTIITYELVLMQFTGVSSTTAPPPDLKLLNTTNS